MDNPQVTEVSVALQFNLANKNNDQPNNLTFAGQDLYKIYSNYSFTCQVDMMGCAQIQPLMYFQLNNIPMFRGAYQIIRVEHNITPGDMTTSFTGVRINKTKIPLVKNGFNIQALNDALDSMSSYDIYKYNDDITLFGDVEDFSSYANICYDGKDLTYGEVKKIPNINICHTSSFTVSDKKYEAREEAFNKLNPYIKSLIVSIAARMDKEGLGLSLNSTTRNTNTSKKSDHTSPSEDITRKHIVYKLNNGTSVKASERGCAVDLAGTKNGVVDKTNGSVPLFHLIATEFTDSIKQLIWEVKDGYSTSSNTVSNCVHLASYNKRDKKSKRAEIFVATEVKGTWGSVKPNNIDDFSKAPTNLPSKFIKTLYDLSLNTEKFSMIRMNNFDKFGKVPTSDDLRKWCEQLNV
jgi:hypothetical protein